MPVSQPADGILGVCKGQKPSELDGPITDYQANWPRAKFWSLTYLSWSPNVPKLAQNAQISDFSVFEAFITVCTPKNPNKPK